MTRLRQRQFATASLLSCDVCVFRPQNGWLAGKKILFHLFAVFPIPFQDLIDVKQQVEDKVPAPLLLNCQYRVELPAESGVLN